LLPCQNSSAHRVSEHQVSCESRLDVLNKGTLTCISRIGVHMAALKLLVVEDDLASLELMTEVFASLKAQVRPMADSQKAAVVINQEKFDGIFLDVEMPRLNGLA